MRAVIPGFINYNFKDGLLPGHTKSAFDEYKILTVHNLIAFNAFLIVEKIRSFPSLLPPSIVSTITTNSPVPKSTHEDCNTWLKIYNTCIYRNSLFFKGPMLYSTSGIIESTDTVKIVTLKSFKQNVRSKILGWQNDGDKDEWRPDNFVLSKFCGLRSSSRTGIVRYTDFF